MQTPKHAMLRDGYLEPISTYSFCWPLPDVNRTWVQAHTTTSWQQFEAFLETLGTRITYERHDRENLMFVDAATKDWPHLLEMTSRLRGAAKVELFDHELTIARVMARRIAEPAERHH